jgi:hypothetical protein
MIDAKKKIIAGDKSYAVCDTCEKVTSITFKYGNFRCDKFVINCDILGFCDTCGNVALVPHQSCVNSKS